MWTTITIVALIIFVIVALLLCMRFIMRIVSGFISTLSASKNKKEGAVEIVDISEIRHHDVHNLMTEAGFVIVDLDESEQGDEVDHENNPEDGVDHEDAVGMVTDESVLSITESSSDQPFDPNSHMRPVVVIDFDDDDADNLSEFEEKVWAVLALNASIPRMIEKVVIRINSPGGAVTTFSRASALLEDLRRDGLYLEAHIDEMAASGGYMLACVCHHIVATKLSSVGSIGVVSEITNVHRVLKSIGVDVYTITGGRLKRTATTMGEMDETAVAEVQKKVNDLHALFKAHVKEHRPDVDIELVSTGDNWTALEAIGLGLVDAIGSSMYELEKMRRLGKHILLVRMKEGRPKISLIMDRLIDTGVQSVFRLIKREVRRQKY
jgi:serine protease SohB